VPCSGVCKAVFSDPQNCGTCGTTCTGATQCLFGACLDPSSVTCSPAAKANSTATRNAFITLGKYWVNNNWWGASSGAAGGENTIWSTCQQGDLIGWGTSWSWANNPNQVKSYASLVLGWQWGLRLPSTSTGLPLTIPSTQQLNCGWNFTVTPQTTGTIDVSYDMFMHTIPNPTSSNDPSDEIMVWLYKTGGAGPSGIKQNSTPLTLAGASWDLYRGMISNQGNGTVWNVFSYVRTNNATTTTMNMMEFFNDLSSRGWLAGKYLTSVETGTEIFTGTGELDTSGFFCRIQ